MKYYFGKSTGVRKQKLKDTHVVVSIIAKYGGTSGYCLGLSDKFFKKLGKEGDKK